MFHANDFRTAAIDSLGDTAIAATLTAARWGVLGWEWYYGAFFSPAAKARYEWAGQMIACLGLLAYLYGKRLRGVVQGWVNAEVDGALPAAEAASADHLPIVGNMVEADPFCPTVNPLPDCSQTAAAPALEGMTIRQLKAAAKGKVPGYGRMTKTQLVQALRTA